MNWIRENTDKLIPVDNKVWKGNFVSHCMPSIFSAYCKIFHPFYTQTEHLHDKPIRWQELTKKYELIFHPEITDYTFARNIPKENWPPHLVTEEGTLDKLTCQRLVEILEPFTDNQKCFFGYDLIATKTGETDLLYTGLLKDVQDTFELENVWGTPTYWWPENRNWCLCTDWDLTFTLVGGSNQLIQAIVLDEDLEALEVRESTRIDYQGDKLNL